MKKGTEERRTTARLEALSDGVYAIAMTLLVLSIDVPRLPRDVTEAELSSALTDIAPKFLVFVLSFVLLAVFWVVHHRQFHRIRCVTGTLIWINMFSLLFVVLLPFSTDLVGEYGHLTIASVVFSLNLFLIGVLYLIQWWYAAALAHLVDPPLTRPVLIATLLLNLVMPFVSLLAIGLAFVVPRHCEWVYFLALPLVSLSRVHIGRVENQREGSTGEAGSVATESVP